WRKARLLNRYSERLFRDVLVPLRRNSESWQALDQAIQVAQRDNAAILALHTVGSQEEVNSPQVGELQEQFSRICAENNVRGLLAVEVGEPTQKILERSALADLIVLKIAYPPSTGIRLLASNIHTLVARASRPILAVPERISNFSRALVAFDGGAKSREALFVAAYLAEQWRTELTILTGLNDQARDRAAQDFARNYLEFNEIEAQFISKQYSAEVLRATAQEVGADLVVMGGYSGSILREMTLGSSVNFMLRASEIPILICR
ncbi:MAG TPA: universal stress protein, partial [Anaerolineales bacterium]